MPYRFLEDIAIADAAFEAWGRTPEEMIAAASDATLNIMVRDLDTVRDRDCRRFQAQDPQIDMLLFRVLQELIYLKDAENLLLRVRAVKLRRQGDTWMAAVEARGEPMNRHRHDLIVDVKAITLHRFCVRQAAGRWTATVVADV